MVNFGFNSASILGIFLALAGGGLYLLRSLRPEVSRDHDIFFAAVGLLCGGILLWHGWRLDPILQFSQLLLAGSAIFFAAESIRLRGVATQQAKGRRGGGTSYVDEDRPVSRVYRAELEDQESYDDGYDYPEEAPVSRRRLQGTATRSSSRRNSNYDRYDDYEEENPRSPRRSSSYDDYDDQGNNPPSNRSSSRRPTRNPRPRNDWQDEEQGWSPEDNYGTSRRPPSTTSNRRPSKKRRPKSADDIVSNVGTEYVDYQPLDEDVNNTEENDRPEQNPRDNYDDR